MSKSILIIAIVAASLGFILVLYKLLKKGGKIAAKLPVNFLIFFLIYALLGLTGFLLEGQVTEYPILIGFLLLLVSITGGTFMTNMLYEKWEWSIAASFGKKILYLFGISLVSIFAFALVFLLCEHQEIPRRSLKSDLVWWLSCIIFIILLPLLIKQLHLLWNKIPKKIQLKQIFELPLGSSPPFIETGGPAINFLFIIPLDYESPKVVKSVVALPLNKTLAEAFHYKLHEHNVVKRFANKIIYAEDNKRSKVYGWCFYQEKSTWWGWIIKKNYLNPNSNLGETISKGDTVFVEREKIWEH